MITIILFILIGLEFKMPVAYYILIGVKVLIEIIDIVLKAFLSGLKKGIGDD